MAEENLMKLNGENMQSADWNTLANDKDVAVRERMSETEIRKRLASRAMEYLMFIDD